MRPMPRPPPGASRCPYAGGIVAATKRPAKTERAARERRVRRHKVLCCFVTKAVSFLRMMRQSGVQLCCRQSVSELKDARVAWTILCSRVSSQVSIRVLVDDATCREPVQ